MSSRLLDRLDRIQDIVQGFSGGTLARIPVEATPADPSAEVVRGPGTGSFHSCGVDSLYTLVQHREELTHVVFMQGFGPYEIDSPRGVARREHARTLAVGMGRADGRGRARRPRRRRPVRTVVPGARPRARERRAHAPGRRPEALRASRPVAPRPVPAAHAPAARPTVVDRDARGRARRLRGDPLREDPGAPTRRDRTRPPRGVQQALGRRQLRRVREVSPYDDEPAPRRRRSNAPPPSRTRCRHAPSPACPRSATRDGRTGARPDSWLGNSGNGRCTSRSDGRHARARSFLSATHWGGGERRSGGEHRRHRVRRRHTDVGTRRAARGRRHALGVVRGVGTVVPRTGGRARTPRADGGHAPPAIDPCARAGVGTAAGQHRAGAADPARVHGRRAAPRPGRRRPGARHRAPRPAPPASSAAASTRSTACCGTVRRSRTSSTCRAST